MWLLTLCVSLSSGFSGVIELFVGVLFANYILFPLLRKNRLVPFPSIITNYIIHCASSSEEARDRYTSDDSSSPLMLDGGGGGGYFGRRFGSMESRSQFAVSQADIAELMVRRCDFEIICRVLVLVVMRVNMLCSIVITM